MDALRGLQAAEQCLFKLVYACSDRQLSSFEGVSRHEGIILLLHGLKRAEVKM